jgi:hypothetical protein
MSTLALAHYPTVVLRIKQANAQRPTMYVEPPRAGPSGITGWTSQGFQDSANARQVLANNPALVRQTAWNQADKGWLNGARIGNIAGSLAGSPLGGTMLRALPGGKVMSAVWPAVGKAISSRGAGRLGSFVAGTSGLGKWMGPGSTVRGFGGSAVGGVAGDLLTYNRLQKDPTGHALAATDRGSPGIHALSKQVAAENNVQQNPLQQMLLSLNNHPEARNALAGLGLGGMGGAALGGLAGHPILGALLGALLGGAVGGFNPQAGNATWQKFYQQAWNRANRMNNQSIA